MSAYKFWQDQIKHFPQKSRYTLGSKIDSVFLETLEYIFLGSIMPRERKLPYIERAVAKFDLLKFFLQIAWEIKSLDTKKYTMLAESLDTIGKMLGGWHKSLLVRQTPSVKKGPPR
jgi:hypothetical protein